MALSLPSIACSCLVLTSARSYRAFQISKLPDSLLLSPWSATVLDAHPGLRACADWTILTMRRAGTRFIQLFAQSSERKSRLIDLKDVFMTAERKPSCSGTGTASLSVQDLLVEFDVFICNLLPIEALHLVQGISTKQCL